jgi:Arylsulfotransferase (ASST)
MRNSREGGPQLTRRRFLAAGGLAVVGAAGIGVFLEACSSAAPSASGAAGPVAAAGLSSATPVPRRIYKSRPDLSAPPLNVASPVGSVAPGFVFITPNNGKAPDGLLMADNSGKPVWIRPDTGAYAANFRPSVYNGKPVLTWWEGATNGGFGSGQLVIVDDTYTELLRIGAGQGRRADIHEFQITPQQTALLLTDQGVPIPAGATPPPYQVWDCIVVELDIQTGAVLFEWHSADHIDPSESVLPAPGTSGSPIPTATPFAPPTPGGSAAASSVPVYDSVHANAIELDTDGHLLVSARNTSTIYKVDRSTGNILWRLGGKKSDFTMGAGTSFGLQHDPRRHADGTLSIFDDGTAGPSRGIVLDIDEVAMTATLVKEYPHPHGKFAMSQGNMEILPNGNVFVGWGSTGTASEFTTDGQLQFDADFSGSIQSYRCFRYPWVAQPKEPPVAVADSPAGGMTNVYASWNGATEVATWEALGGTDPASLSSLGQFPRSDFETVLAVKATSGMVAVNALDKSGAVLGTSKAVAIPD